ncbi:MAG: class 1 fructose-bisphosphatase [Rhodobacteraceae bacterium]|nr:class 1 fructose-bisphosphatase [Paracoccaceae bacterium]MCW9044641.1 class 1 fructose-bisphosphatase [Pseudopelagicola sp.]
MTDNTSSIVTDHIPEPLRPLMAAICAVSVDVARIIARGPLGEALGAQVGAANADGDDQKALDVIADEMFAAALAKTSTRFWASEERDEVIELNPEGQYVVAMDPLDGSSNIDVNVSIGSIFSIYEAKATGEASVLRPATEQIAGGYVIYGPQTGLVVTFGDGTQHYILDPDTQRFELVEARMVIPPQSSEFAINASNYRHWTKPVRAFIDDCIAGSEGPRGRNFNMRWVASLVAETHRIITRGGVFLYPSDGREGYDLGRLRMLYECAPIAFVVEQAGGLATDGSDPIMDKAAGHLHQRTPFVFGSSEKVARVATYHDLPEHEVSALFGRRGLFRN